MTSEERPPTMPAGHLVAVAGGARPALRAHALARAYWPGLLLLTAAACLYLLTLDDGLQPSQLLGGDLITHQYAQAQARPSNAPGYPLYTMGGWLWFHGWRLVLGAGHNPVPILSSYSTLWALVALALLYRLILEITDHGQGGNQAVAVLVSAFYAVSYFFWYYAVSTEQYASAVAWTLAVIWLALRWERTRRDAYLLWLALLAGVALAHMLTLVLIMPPLLWFVLSREPRLLRRPRLLLAAAGLVVLPLLSYAYVYVRGAQHPEWRGAGHWASAWDWFWSFVSTNQGRAELTWSLTPLFTDEFPALIWRELTWPGLILGLAGLGLLGARRAALLYASLAIYFAFCWVDRLGNWFQVIMPAYAIVTLGLAAAADTAWRGGTRLYQRRGGSAVGTRRNLARAVPGLVVVGLGGLALARGLASYPAANLRDRAGDTGLAPGQAILADNPPAGTAVLGTLPEELALNYLTGVWGIRPDVHAVSADQARALLQNGKAVLAVTDAALPLVAREIDAQAHYSALGRTLVAISATPAAALPPGLQAWNEDFAGGLLLAGGRATYNHATGETVVVLGWRAQARPARDLSVSVRLTQQGAEIAQVDRQNPVWGAYPTTRWSPGEAIGDAYPFSLPPGAAPDGVTVIVYYQDASGNYVNYHTAHLPLSVPQPG